MSKFRNLVKEWLIDHPIDNSRQYYPEDWAKRDTRNEVKEKILSFLEETSNEDEVVQG